MLSTSYKHVPSYLHESELYKSFDPNDDSNISVPPGCLKPHPSVDSSQAFYELLMTMKFWMLEKPPKEVFEYIFSVDVKRFESKDVTVWQLFESFLFANEILMLRTAEPNERIEFAVKNRMSCDTINILSVLHCPVPQHMCALVVATNQANVLKLAHTNFQCKVTETAAFLAAQSGKVEMLAYMLIEGVEPSEMLAVAAAGRGHISCLQLLEKFGCKFTTDVCCTAAARGHALCLKFLLNCCHEKLSRVVESAARHDKVNCLKIAVEQGCPLSAQVMIEACAVQSVDCLFAALDLHCPLTIEAVQQAAQSGYLLGLIAMHAQGAPWDERVCSLAAQHGHLLCLRFAHNHGCPWTEDTIAWALSQGQSKCASYALSMGCPSEKHITIYLCFMIGCVVSIVNFMRMFPVDVWLGYVSYASFNLSGICHTLQLYMPMLQHRWPTVNWIRMHFCFNIFYQASLIIYYLYLMSVLVWLAMM